MSNVRTLWKDEDKYLDKSFKPTEVTVEVYQNDKYNEQTRVYDERYMYRVNVDPGYPDGSGVKIVLFGFANSKNEAFEKGEALVKEWNIKEVISARGLHVLYDKEDEFKS